MTIDRLERELSQRLAEPLPGVSGQIHMAPRPRIGWRPDRIPREVRHSGVLLLIFPLVDEPHIVLTVRTSHLAHHAGQVSLPGGALESGETIEQAALRETHEEVGVEPGALRLVGALTSLHVPVSRNVLHPRVAFAGSRPDWRPDAREVERVLEVPLRWLRDTSCLAVDRQDRFERSVEVPYFRVGREKVWGATAMVLSELLTLLGRPPNPWLDDAERTDYGNP